MKASEFLMDMGADDELMFVPQYLTAEDNRQIEFLIYLPRLEEQVFEERRSVPQQDAQAPKSNVPLPERIADGVLRCGRQTDANKLAGLILERFKEHSSMELFCQGPQATYRAMIAVVTANRMKQQNQNNSVRLCVRPMWKKLLDNGEFVELTSIERGSSAEFFMAWELLQVDLVHLVDAPKDLRLMRAVADYGTSREAAGAIKLKLVENGFELVRAMRPENVYDTVKTVILTSQYMARDLEAGKYEAENSKIMFAPEFVTQALDDDVKAVSPVFTVVLAWS
jgi:stage V sporulation protein SpoVS